MLVDGLKYNMDLIYAVGAVPKAQTITNSNVLCKYLQHALFVQAQMAQRPTPWE